MTIIARKLGGGVINEELRVKNEKCKRHSSLFNLHSSLSFLIASVLALWIGNVWAASLSFIAALDEGMSQTIVCYGTSLTEKGAWVAGLDDALNRHWPGKVTVINAGMSGVNSKVGLDNVQEKVLSKNPDAVFIEFSMNDAADSLNSGKTQEQALADAESNLKSIISAIKTSCPSCEIILQTMNPYVKVSGSTLSERTGLENHVAMYRRVALENGYLLIDNWPLWMQVLSKSEEEYLKLVPDGVHPNEYGSKSIALRNILKTLDLYSDRVFDKDYKLSIDEAYDAVGIENGITLNLAGNILTCSSLAGTGTITSTGGDADLTEPNGVVTWSTKDGIGQGAYGGTGENLFNNTSWTKNNVHNNAKRIMVTKVNLPLSVTYDFGEGTPKTVNKYKMYFGGVDYNEYNERGPKEWTFEGSNDGVNWIPLHSKDDVTWANGSSPKDFSFENNIAYRYYRITFIDSSDNDSGYLELNQLEYFYTNPGELHVDVDAGKAVNLSVSISGNTKVFKEGAGTLIGITQIASSANTTVGLIVNGGKVAVDNATLYVGYKGAGTLTINGGIVDVSSADQNVNLAVENGSSGTINLNGGTLKTRRIVKQNGSSAALNFNGGTLQANRTNNTGLSGGLISSTVTVTVNDGGGTIDSGNLSVKVGAAISGTGAMRFKGGETITLQGANSYDGGTTIELGTKVVTSVEVAKNTILGNLVIDGKSRLTDANGIVVFEYGSALTDSDIANVKLVNCGEASQIYIDGDSIKVDFVAPAWKLEGDANWSDLVATYGAPAADAIVIIAASDENTLTINQDVTVGQIVFTGNNPKVVVESGCTVTVDTINFNAANTDYHVLNNGAIVLNGTGITSMKFHNDSRGVYYVNAGRLQVSGVKDGNITPGLEPEGKNQFVCVASGATYDVHGIENNTAAVRLAAGATVANEGGSSVTTSNKQIPQLILDGDATAKIHRSFGLVGTGSDSETRLDLGEHILTINGSGNTYSFFMYNTTVCGSGKVFVKEGKLATYGNSRGDSWSLEIGPSGHLLIGEKPSGNTLTVGDFVNKGTDSSVANGGFLVVKGMLTPGNSIKKLKLDSGATVKATGTAQVVSSTFSASGIVYIDASAITKEQLKEAADERIPILTVPTANKGGTWHVVNPPVAGVREKWIDNENDTCTLCLYRSSGMMIIVR